MRFVRRLLGTEPTRADRVAVGLLAGLPVLLQLPFALMGRPLLGGDNLTQNYPLRVLAGEMIRHGRLPLWNPDVWSGSPLLAGWNAGAMYPGTWLFAVLPGVAAWEVNAIAVGVVAGVGMHAFLRRRGCSPVASLLAALTFADMGFMSGQSVHLGLVTGMSFLPWMLMALDRMAAPEADRRSSSLLLPAAVLGTAGGLVVLAGDPRAISNVAIVLVIDLVALCWTELRRRDAAAAGRLVAGCAGAVVLALLLSAVQWLPGLDFLHQSQRASGRLAYFGSYSLRWSQLAYGFVQFLFGGNGSLGLPTTNFNLPELTVSVGLVPVVAFFVLGTRWVIGLGRGRRGGAASDRGLDSSGSGGSGRSGRSGQGGGVWLAMVVVGVVLSLGTTTPLAHLLVHVPLFGGERLQSRNMGIADFALCVLLALFLDLLGTVASAATAATAFGPDSADLPTPAAAAPTRLTLAERVAGAVPSFVAGALVVAMLAATAATESWLGAPSPALGLPGRMAPYYAVEIALAVVMLVVVLRPHWPGPAVRRRLACGVAAVDIAVFVGMASYQPAPTSALAERNSAVSALTAAAGGRPGRFALLDPQQLPVDSPPHAIDDLGFDDLAVIHHLPSVQGYGSAVSASYEAATGAHEVENLRPSALLGPTFGLLDLRVLAVVPELFGTSRGSLAGLVLAGGRPQRPGSSIADRQPGDTVQMTPYPPTGPWSLGAGASVDLVLPGPTAIDQVALRVGGPSTGTTRYEVTVHFRSGGDLTVGGRATSGGLVVVHVPPTSVIGGGGAVGLTLRNSKGGPSDVRAVAVHTVAWTGDVPLVSSGTAKGQWFELDGLLQGLLSPGRWQFAGSLGALDLYRSEVADGEAWLEAPGSRSPTDPRVAGSVTVGASTEWHDPVDDADVPHGALLVRSEAEAPGWSVTISPLGQAGSGSPTRALRVVAVGPLQGVELPPGHWVVRWEYRPARAEVGFVLSCAGTLLLAAALVVVWRRRRRRTDGDRPAPGDPPAAFGGVDDAPAVASEVAF